MIYKLLRIIAKITLAIAILFMLFFVLFGVASNTVLHNLPVIPSDTPTMTFTPRPSNTLTPTNTPVSTDTPEPTEIPTTVPSPTITLAVKKDGYTNDLCENISIDIMLKANVLDAQGAMVHAMYDAETNSCSYRFVEEGWFGDIFGYGTILLSIKEQEAGVANLTFYYKDTTERAEQIVDWSAAILSVINPNTNVLAASNTIAESAKNTLAMSDQYTVYTQLDLTEMKLNIVIADVEELIQ